MNNSQEASSSEQTTSRANVAEESPVLDSGFVSCENPGQRMGTLEVPTTNGNICGVNGDIELAKSFCRDLTLQSQRAETLSDIDNTSNKSTGRSDVASTTSQETSLDFWKHPYEHFFKQDSDGDTQLHIAIAMKLTEAALWLIGVVPHSCLLDLPNNNIHTVLHLAVLSREPRIVRRLILAGANPDAQSAIGNTALHLACALGDFECVRAITESLTSAERAQLLASPQTRVPRVLTTLDSRNFHGKTCLHIAATNGHVNIVDQLLSQGANVNAPEGHAGMTCLHLAIENGHLEVVRYLSQRHPICLDAVTYAGITTYQLAMERDPNLANELAENYGVSRIIIDDHSDNSSINDSNSDNCSEDEITNSDQSHMSDDHPNLFSPRLSPFLGWDWAATRTRST